MKNLVFTILVIAFALGCNYKVLKIEQQKTLVSTNPNIYFEFPILKCSECEYGGERISYETSMDLLNTDITDSANFRLHYPLNADLQMRGPITALSYKVNTLTDKFYAVTFFVEGCRAYCEYYEKDYNYDLKNNSIILLSEIFSTTGLDSLANYLTVQKRTQLNNYFITRDTNEFLDEEEIKGIEQMEEIYSSCFKHASFSTTSILNIKTTRSLLPQIDVQTMPYKLLMKLETLPITLT